MRKLVLILIAFIAVVTFIRAYDNSDRAMPAENGENYSLVAE
jgi:uncharacterized membrane protein